MIIYSIIVSIVLFAAPPAKPAPSEPPPLAPPAETVFKDQLAGLSPGDPKSYFELGERVSAEAVDYSDVMLAKRLFVLAYEIDRTSKAPAGVAASSCVALASLPPLAKDRSWLLSIATLIDPRYASSSAALTDDAVVPPAIGYQVAATLGMVRSGEGFAARTMLEQADVQQVLKRYERLLTASGSGGMINKLKSEAAKWPCQTCANARFTKSPGSSDARKCPVCDALPGWRLSDDDLESQLSLEAKLLAGIQSSWAAQVLSDADAPLRESDPSSVAAALGVDIRKTVYRDGTWVDPNPPPADTSRDPGKQKGDTLPPKSSIPPK